MTKKINDISNFKFKDGDKIIIRTSNTKKIYNHISADVYEIDHNIYELNIYDHTLYMEHHNPPTNYVTDHIVNRNKNLYIVRMCEEPINEERVTKETDLFFKANPFINFFFDFVSIYTHPEWLYKTLVVYDQTKPNNQIYIDNYKKVKEYTKFPNDSFYKKINRAKKIQKLNCKFNQHT